MPKDLRNLVQVLRSELVFLDAGGYSAWAGARWRLPLIFEESPACPNFNDCTHTVKCQDCSLARLVPLRHRFREVPCRHIALDAAGDTLDSLYRSATEEELQRVYRGWLVSTLDLLEKKQVRRQWLRDQSVYRAAEST